MGSMGFMITVSVLLIVGAVVGVVAQRRTQRNRPPSDLDAEAEANHWLVRLGGGLVPPDARAWAGADEAAGRSLTSAAECHRAARAQLAGARTAGEYAEVTRVAREGLEHLRSARTALGIDSDVAVSMPPHAVRVSAVGGSCAVTSR
jgi:hypothetical protein